MEILFQKKLEHENFLIEKQLFMERHKKLTEAIIQRNKMLPSLVNDAFALESGESFGLGLQDGSCSERASIQGSTDV